MNELLNNENFILIQKEYPHIAKKLELMYGYPEFNILIRKLFNDSRDGDRQGFASNIASALFRLMKLHDEKFPQDEKQDIWGKAK